MNKLLNDLKRLPNFAITSLDRKAGYGYGKCNNLLIRWRKSERDKAWIVEFSVRKHFDRWANSTNFRCELQYDHPFRPDVKDGYKWMMKVIKSNLFDWNRYFHTLDMHSEYVSNKPPRPAQSP